MVTMQDPFRPNSNAQLLREAQMGFVVIGLLLCVLVYVAFYRLTNRSSRFDAIAQNVAVAESVNGDPYQANIVLQTEKKLEERLANHDSGLLAALEDFSPLGKTSEASKLPKTTRDEKVAQATYMPPTGNINDLSSTRQTHATVPQSLPKAKHAFKAQLDQADPAVTKSGDLHLKKTQVLPPVLKSNFGSTPNHDFQPATPLSKPESKIDPTGFNATPSQPLRQPSQANVKQASPLPPKSSPSKPDSIDKMLAHQRPSVAAQAQTAAPAQVETLPSPSLKKTHPAKNDFAQQENASLIAQTSGIEAIETAPKKPPAKFTQQLPRRSSFDISADASPKKRNQTADSNTREYLTKEGDSLWTIAQTVYGDGRYFRALHELNRETLSPTESMLAGTLLKVTTIKQLQNDYPELCPRQANAVQAPTNPDGADGLAADELLDIEMDQRFYRTEDGDTLFEIARQRLGQASRYLEIYDLNRFRIPETANHLTPLGGGIQLLLPELSASQ